SWNGKEYVLDAEPYGGAITRGLERTDYTELENLVADQGSYRVLLTNEMEEAQHTNQFDLVVTDARPGLEVVIHSHGLVHGCRKADGPLRAFDEKGRDLMPWLVHREGVAWHPDLDAATSALPLADTRNHVTIEFARPTDTTRAYLLADVATAPWGAH